MTIKKVNIIVIFYILYFSWLFTVAFLTPSINTLNYFTSFVAVFYFLLLRQEGDLFWFWASAAIPLILSLTSFSNWQFKFDLEMIKFVPLWLPLAWGTTVVALRKFYYLISR